MALELVMNRCRGNMKQKYIEQTLSGGGNPDSSFAILSRLSNEILEGRFKSTLNKNIKVLRRI